jgi:hypothetical protein
MTTPSDPSRRAPAAYGTDVGTGEVSGDGRRAGARKKEAAMGDRHGPGEAATVEHRWTVEAASGAQVSICTVDEVARVLGIGAQA